jgi:hypothetical protein
MVFAFTFSLHLFTGPWFIPHFIFFYNRLVKQRKKKNERGKNEENKTFGIYPPLSRSDYPSQL